MITCYLQYELNPEKIAEFEDYAGRWIELVARFGGIHHGYFLPHESSNSLALALFSFPSLAEYEVYRTESVNDPDCQAAYEIARQSRCIRRFDRQFLRPVLSNEDGRESNG